MSTKPRSIWVAILAGGDGASLRPSPLRISLQRALAVTSRERIVTVVTETHRRGWERELFTYPSSTVVVEPCDRGTGLGVLLTLLVIAKSDPEAGVLFIPSDHYVEHESILAEHLREATAPEVMNSEKLTLLGMSRSAPDSGFGYLSPVPDSGVGMRPVLWNSGIIAGRISQFIALYPRHMRQMIIDLQAIVEHWPDSRVPSAGLTSLYARLSALDFSSDLLQKRPENVQLLNVPPRAWKYFHPQVAQRGFAWVAQSPRLAPYEES
jgi:mannose-1-phosphate guanylyltransferase